MTLPTDMLMDTVTRYAYQGETGAGPSWGTGTSVRCYVEGCLVQTTDAQGGAVTADTLVMSNGAVWAVRDKFLWGGVTYAVVKVDTFRPYGAVSHQEVYGTPIAAA